MADESKKLVKIPFQITVGNLASRLELDIAEVIKKLMDNGIMATINDFIDYETAVIVAEELGFETEQDQEVSNEEVVTQEQLGEILRLERENKDNLSPRPPIVTILGHVDHGKTTLLDTLRKTRIAEKESGGITQHINAYQVEKEKKLITFIDTPGHEAFQAMRERGASLADIAILVVAADDGVKPQTKEVATHLIESKIPIVVAINKTDKPEANINKVKQELAEVGILLEGYGGDVPYNEISAKNNVGLDELLETILLVAEVHNFSANKERTAFGTVLEAHKDPQKGPLATVVVQTGALKVGQNVLVGDITGRIRKIEDYAGNSLQEALPSLPVTIIGLSGVPESSDVLQIQEEVSSKKQQKIIRRREAEKMVHSSGMSSSELIQNIDVALMKKYSVILKADAKGSLEAIKQILETIKSDEVRLNIFSEGIGSITETDIYSAQTNGANVYGFSVMPTTIANQVVQKTGVSVKTFNIIYELIEDIKSEMSELLDPEIKRTDLGKLKILAIFKNMKTGMVVGGKVTTGKIVKGEKLEVVRDKEVIGSGKLVQLQQDKKEVKEVKEGRECGITFEGKEKVQEGDVIVCYREEEIKRKI